MGNYITSSGARTQQDDNYTVREGDIADLRGAFAFNVNDFGYSCDAVYEDMGCYGAPRLGNFWEDKGASHAAIAANEPDPHILYPDLAEVKTTDYSNAKIYQVTANNGSVEVKPIDMVGALDSHQEDPYWDGVFESGVLSIGSLFDGKLSGRVVSGNNRLISAYAKLNNIEGNPLPAFYDELERIGINSENAETSAAYLVRPDLTPEEQAANLAINMGPGFVESYRQDSRLQLLALDRIKDATPGQLVNVSDFWGSAVRASKDRAFAWRGQTSYNTTLLLDYMKDDALAPQALRNYASRSRTIEVIVGVGAFLLPAKSIKAPSSFVLGVSQEAKTLTALAESAEARIASNFGMYAAREAKVIQGIASRSANSDLPVYMVSRSRTPGIATNIETGIAEGQPNLLTRQEGRSLIRANRRDALRGQRAPDSSQSLDEYPFASTSEGGTGSRVASVPRVEQNIQGGELSQFYQRFNIKDGDQFYVMVVD